MIPKTLGKNKTSAVYKPKTIFNKNNCPIICDIYRKLLSLSIENKEINKLLKLVWLPVSRTANKIMNILRFLLSSFLWAMGGIFVLAIYAYSELVYLIFICIAIVGLTIYYRKSIIKMYAEIFNELGINKYVIQIKNLKKYKEPIYKLINTIGL